MAGLPEHAHRAPAGGLPYVETVPPRRWVLPLLTGTRLTAHDRPHWARRAAVTKEWRRLAGWHAANARIGRLPRAHILIEWLPPASLEVDAVEEDKLGKVLDRLAIGQTSNLALRLLLHYPVDEMDGLVRIPEGMHLGA